MHIRALGGGLLAALLLAPPAVASVESEIAFHRGVVAYGEGRLDVARAEFEKVLAEEPQDTAAIHYLGLIARKGGDPVAAIQQYQRALAIDPDDQDIRLDLGVAQVETGRVKEARRTLDQVLAADPDRAEAHLFAGIAAYRDGDYEAAVPHLDRAVSLDPALRAHARFYSGLAQAFRGDIPAARGAFEEAEQSPISPLARSARQMREQLQPERPRWNASLTAGIEWDSNPTFDGKGKTVATPLTGAIGPGTVVFAIDDQKDDFRGVFQANADYRIVDTGSFDLTAGYEGYWSLHSDADEVDLQTHALFGSAGYTLDPVRFNLRYDYAYTFISISDPFRSVNRVTPSISWRQSNWGVTQLYYSFRNEEFLRNNGVGTLNRDGILHTAGVTQFLFLPTSEILSYLRFGALGEWRQTDGREFDYNAWELSAGGGVELPFDVTVTGLYRFTRQMYDGNSIFDPDPPVTFAGGAIVTGSPQHRDDSIHRLTLEAVRPITDHVEVSIASSFRFQNSDVGFYDFNRHVTGAYLTYRF